MSDIELDCGLTITQLAHSLMRTFVGCAFRDKQETHDLVLDGASGAGWMAVALKLAGYYAQSAQREVSVPFDQLTQEIHLEFCGTAGWAYDPVMPARTRLAWEAVARHGTGVLGADDGETGRILDAEAAWRDWLHRTALKRGIPLE